MSRVTEALEADAHGPTVTKYPVAGTSKDAVKVRSRLTEWCRNVVSERIEYNIRIKNFQKKKSPRYLKSCGEIEGLFECETQKLELLVQVIRVSNDLNFTLLP